MSIIYVIIRNIIYVKELIEMGYAIFFDVGFLIFIIAMFFLMVGGLAYGLVDFLSSNIETIITVCVIVAILEMVITWSWSKKWLSAFLSLIYSSQYCFFAVYGLYQLGLMYEEHPIKCILLFFCYALYALVNSIGLLLPFATEKNKSQKLDMGSLGFIALGLLGWLINWIVL